MSFHLASGGQPRRAIRSMPSRACAPHRGADCAATLFVLLTSALLILCASRASGQTTQPPVAAELTLAQALQLVLDQSPVIRAAAWEMPKAAGRLRQAGLRPNPEAAVDLENFAGSNAVEPDATISLGQTVELGGKRRARIAAARADRSVVALDIEARRIEVAAEAAARFFEALALENVAALYEEEVRAAEEAVRTTSQRVRSGAAHPVEERRAEVEVANIRLERVLAEARLAVARSQLSSLWGEPTPRFERLSGRIEPPSDSLRRAVPAASLDSIPAVRRWSAEVLARRNRLALERAQGIPDLGVGVGIRSLGTTDERVLIGGFSIPLPIFHRNQGAAAEALAAMSQGEDERAVARIEAGRNLIEVENAISRSRRKLDTLRQEVLPGASRAFEDMRTGFDRGRFSYLDLVEARRTWIRARREELNTSVELRLADIELAQLTVRSALEFAERIGGLR